MTTDQKNTSKSKAPDHVILIIDDDHNSLEIVSGYLEECGYTILIAEDGESGLKRAEYARPDLILLDIMMPGLDGYETCRRLNAMESTRDIPVIIMTALADTGYKIRGFEAGAVDYVTKPVQREEVVARVGVHLRIRSLTTTLQKANESLEHRIEERTAELRDNYEKLALELSERKRVEEALHLQTAELEEEMAERQMAQDNLQEKAFLLEEEIEKRQEAQDELGQLNKKLEQRVQERTAELAAKNAELARMNRIFIGRELRMVELKERIRELEKKPGGPIP